jgi:hypothetical protein
MIPESLRRQQRALYLHAAPIRGETLTPREQKELAGLDARAQKEVRLIVQRTEKMIAESNRKRKGPLPKGLGTYCVQAA